MPEHHRNIIIGTSSEQLCLIYTPPGLLEKDSSPLIEFFANSLSPDLPTILLGDFNLHVDASPQSLACEAFLTSLEAMGFQQIVNSPTHKAGQTLDLIFINSPFNISNPPSCIAVPWSDHSLIQTKLTLPQSSPALPHQPISFNFRKSCTVDTITQACSDIDNQIDLTSPDNAFSTWVNLTLSIANKHCPLITKTVNPNRRNRKPWYTPDLRNLKTQLRAAERSWRKHQSPATKTIYYQRMHEYRNSILQTKRDYYAKKIHGLQYNPKALFSMVADLTSHSHTQQPTNSSKNRCNELAQFLKNKVSAITAQFSHNNLNICLPTINLPVSLSSLDSSSSLEVENILKKMKPSSQSL
ncbi:coiled-coil domain-containing protein 166 isoform X2 [Rhinatrema bivittatum]|uniref:coiled-coil domain-containing protein 166 isoform X2 n=1 Tax=Rhinatrema bivittatum TaxID=194408 RepID=UPI00112C292B|nr:coiled-coil domain-containing protein 166 isoform X2 [Rhinatrema bivittatum]